VSKRKTWHVKRHVRSAAYVELVIDDELA